MGLSREIRIFFPFNEFSPDLGLLNNPGLIRCQDFALINGKLAPIPFIAQFTAALSAQPLGLASFPDGTSDYLIHYGSDDDLYTIEPGTGVETNRTRTVGGTYNVQNRGWFFLPWGADMIAVCGTADEPQIRIGTAANYVGLINSPAPYDDLRPRYICGIGALRTLLGFVRDETGAVTYPNRVWWSYTDDARSYGTPATAPTQRSDFQDLFDDYGEVSGLAGGADYAYVFKKRALYRMDYGGPYQFTFKAFGEGSGGTRYANSIVRAGNDVYFWGPLGPSVVKDGQVIPIGQGKVSRTLFYSPWVVSPTIQVDTANTPQGEICGVYDAANNSVMWNYRTQAASSGPSNVILVYHIATDRWSYKLFTTADVGVWRMASKHDTNDAWRIGRDVLLAYRTSATNYIARFESGIYDNQSRFLRSGRYIVADLLASQSRERASQVKVNWIRPAISFSNTAAPVITYTVDMFLNPADTTADATSSATHDASSGRCEIESSAGAVVQFSIEINGDAAAWLRTVDIEGFEVSFTTEGDPG